MDLEAEVGLLLFLLLLTPDPLLSLALLHLSDRYLLQFQKLLLKLLVGEHQRQQLMYQITIVLLQQPVLQSLSPSAAEDHPPCERSQSCLFDNESVLSCPAHAAAF